MKAARERPGGASWQAWAPRRPEDSTDIGTKGRAEVTRRCARRLEASRVAAVNPGVCAAPLAKDAAAGGDDGNVTHLELAR
jgi:hypothetical protein